MTKWLLFVFDFKETARKTKFFRYFDVKEDPPNFTMDEIFESDEFLKLEALCNAR